MVQNRGGPGRRRAYPSREGHSHSRKGREGSQPGLARAEVGVTYLAGRTSTCMNPPLALMLFTLIWVPVFGVITLPVGLFGSQ